jgi:hypothetical protein
MYNWVWTTPVELTKKDFFLSSYNRIRIKSKTQVEIQRKKEVQALSQLVNLVMSMDNIDNYQKLLLLRDFAEWLWYDKNKIDTRLWWWPEEELIKEENWILEDWIYYPISEEDNHFMHIILQKPFKNSTQEALLHFQAHITAWIAQWKPKDISVNWTQQAMQASMAASSNAQMNQSNPQWATLTT